MPILDEYPVATTRMTADDVLAVLVDHHRLIVQTTISPRIGAIDRTMTIKQWLRLVEGFWFEDAVATLQLLFEIKPGRAAWREVLLPLGDRTLGEVCDYIASLGPTLPTVEPVHVLGESSPMAGAFLAVRRALLDAGADVSELKPTSLLRPYLLRHGKRLIPALRRMAPGQLPTLIVEAPVHEALGIARVACGMTAMICIFTGHASTMGWQAAAITWVLYLAELFAARLIRPWDVRLAGLRTFRDLSRVLAGQSLPEGPAFEIIPVRYPTDSD